MSSWKKSRVRVPPPSFAREDKGDRRQSVELEAAGSNPVAGVTYLFPISREAFAHL